MDNIIKKARKEVLKNNTLSEIKDRYFNEIGYHECLDRIFMLSENFDEYIYHHPIILFNDDMATLATEINDKLWDLYQLVINTENDVKTTDKADKIIFT